MIKDTYFLPNHFKLTESVHKSFRLYFIMLFNKSFTFKLENIFDELESSLMQEAQHWGCHLENSPTQNTLYLKNYLIYFNSVCCRITTGCQSTCRLILVEYLQLFCKLHSKTWHFKEKIGIFYQKFKKFSGRTEKDRCYLLAKLVFFKSSYVSFQYRVSHFVAPHVFRSQSSLCFTNQAGTFKLVYGDF